MKRDINAIVRANVGARRNNRPLSAHDGIAAPENTLRIQGCETIHQPAGTCLCEG